MISFLELRHILETSFLPACCICDVDVNQTLTVRLINPTTHQVELTVTGIDAQSLTSSRAIARLVMEVKEEARLLSTLPVQRYQRKIT
ncbi:DUF1652 domain-containing protein [Pseudomonas sp. DD1]|uniref:DUF1652 domain-containing protein n=1 Tax=Pseudomonas sp. DD1 TaxID=879558 RepID=UPI0037C5FBB7